MSLFLSSVASDFTAQSLERPYDAAHDVVRAACWSDGGTDFIYGDGTVLSFMDGMNTFVALSPSAASRSMQGEREACFTAWTLSYHLTKVSAALGIFNALSERPRLIAELLPNNAAGNAGSGDSGSSVKVWRDAGPPMSTLLLQKHKDLFQRHVVSAVFCEAHDGPPPASGPVGTVLVFSCVLRRIYLTIAVHRQTFTVRWPAAVTDASGSQRRLTDWVAVGSSLHELLQSEGGQLYTEIEQTFPVANPPAAWALMLGMALELDEELPPDHQPNPAAEISGNGSLHHLPQPLEWRGALNGGRNTNLAHFSPLTAAEWPHIAAPSLSRSLDGMRRLRSPTALLCWVYDAGSKTLPDPPAVFWSLPAITKAGEAASVKEGSACREAAEGSPAVALHSVLAAVSEDGSAVCTTMEGDGYTVQHARIGSAYASPSVYRIHADGQAELPPRIPPLRYRAAALTPPHASSGHRVVKDYGDGNTPLNSAAAGESCACGRVAFLCLTQGKLYPFLPSTAYSSMSSPLSRRTSYDLASGCSVLRQLTRGAFDTPLNPLTSQQVHDTTLLLHREDKGRGRYLALVGGKSVAISQLNCSVHRAKWNQVKATSTNAVLYSRAAYCHSTAPPGPTNPASTSAAAGTVSRSLRYSQDDGVVHLTSRLDGIATFTALTNGTTRAHFTDRTILLLIPGPNEYAEDQLIASCLYRDATRCTMRVTQCPPGHRLYRYLSYLLCFRRYVYRHAAAPHLDSPGAFNDMGDWSMEESKRPSGKPHLESRSDTLQMSFTDYEDDIAERSLRVERLLHENETLSLLNRALLQE